MNDLLEWLQANDPDRNWHQDDDGDIVHIGESVDGDPTVIITDAIFGITVRWSLGWHDQQGDPESSDGADVLRLVEAMTEGGRAMDKALEKVR